MAGARLIVGIDINNDKKDISSKLGVNTFVNPTEVNDVKEHLLGIEKWGFDFTFDCTGNVKVMR